jgi:hypothetical protein
LPIGSEFSSSVSSRSAGNFLLLLRILYSHCFSTLLLKHFRLLIMFLQTPVIFSPLIPYSFSASFSNAFNLFVVAPCHCVFYCTFTDNHQANTYTLHFTGIYPYDLLAKLSATFRAIFKERSWWWRMCVMGACCLLSLQSGLYWTCHFRETAVVFGWIPVYITLTSQKHSKSH